MSAPLLVLGATGVVGRGVVEAAVEAARPVIAVARDAERLARLRTRHAGADLTVVARSIAGDAGAERLAAALTRLRRPLSGVIAAVGGGSGRGRLLDQPVSALRRELEDDLLLHLAAARHLLPLLAESQRRAAYVLIGGPGSEAPWAGYGRRSVGAAAQRMLASVLHDEARAFGVRVQLLAVDAPACTERNRLHACPRWPTPYEIGRRAIELVERAPAGRPAQAIVRFVARGTATADPMHPTAAPPAGTGQPPEPAQGEERRSGGSASRCLDDARALLHTLASTNRNEVSR